MNIKQIINGIECTLYCDGKMLREAPDIDISAVVFDSRQVKKDVLFVAQRGVHVDGHRFIADAVHSGAAAILCEELPEAMAPEVLYIQVAEADYALGVAASHFYGDPSRKLSLVGITGTNGKTTTVTLLHRLFRNLGHHTGLLSTIVNRIDDEEYPTSHTTPDAVEINAMLARMVEQGCDYCFMEVSSHAIVQNRIAGLQFAGAIFSNITHDHLDFHKTMANYIAAKKKFFDDLPATAFALTNIDDKNGRVMVQNCKGKVKTYSLQTLADYHCKVEETTFQGQQLTINGVELWTPLVGRFNAYNITAIAATAMLCGVEPREALRGVSALQAAPGRFQYVRGKGITAIVDYAHTPDALQNVIETINEIRQHGQDLIVVVGCGGDRDPLKRPVMAKIAAEGSNHLVLTSDNPRTEDPNAILDAMEAGLTDEERFNAVRISDRRQAIKTAVMMAREGDIVLVAGKGHETYQEINGVRHHFDDREELRKLLADGSADTHHQQ